MKYLLKQDTEVDRKHSSTYITCTVFSQHFSSTWFNSTLQRSDCALLILQVISDFEITMDVQLYASLFTLMIVLVCKVKGVSL